MTWLPRSSNGDMHRADPMEIPTGPEALTPEWLTQALRDKGAIQNASVASFEAKPMGQGGLGQIVRLSLSYDRPESGAPRTIIGKFSSAVPAQREQLRAWRVYEREVRFYEHIAQRIPLRTPHCYYGVNLHPVMYQSFAAKLYHLFAAKVYQSFAAKMYHQPAGGEAPFPREGMQRYGSGDCLLVRWHLLF